MQTCVTDHEFILYQSCVSENTFIILDYKWWCINISNISIVKEKKLVS